LPGPGFVGKLTQLGRVGAPVAHMSPSVAEVGSVIAGRYRLLRCLGQGGMASVWAAQHLSLRAEVAIKLIDPRIADQAEALQRFHREARAAANLRSNHVVQVFDHGLDDGVPFMVMELLHGENLAEYLERHERLKPADTLRVITHVGRAMARAHAAGITHRDLKPENVFLVEDEDAGQIAKVLDFGVAKVNGQVGISHRFPTRSGVILGTPWYMSPEQVQGEASVDYRSDLWSMAVLTFECLVGKRPFEHHSLGHLAEQICKHPAPRPSEHAALPPEFDAWFAKAIAKKREERFDSARTMIEALERALRPIVGEARAFGEVEERDSHGNDLSPKLARHRSDEPRELNADRGSKPTQAKNPARHKHTSIPRLFLDGMIVCLVTLFVAAGIFIARRSLGGLTEPDGSQDLGVTTPATDVPLAP
jgi:serine/threonine protein kinase